MVVKGWKRMEIDDGEGGWQLVNRRGWVLWRYAGQFAEHGTEWMLHRNVNAKAAAVFYRLTQARAIRAADALIRAIAGG